MILSVERNDGCCSGISADEIVDCEQAASVLDVIEVLIVECELGAVVCEDCDVEDVYCAGCHQLGAEDETVGC